MLVFISALFMVARIWRQTRCFSIEDWIKKRWYIPTREFYSDIRKGERFPFGTTWIGLENIMLS